ncbi:MAG TPA: type II secretion system F family protein [Patescibacteria group bacterium]|nr:type II secretion system F family protein [Patescibacteria group bacterium]
MRFLFKAKTRSGEIKDGRIEAMDYDAAVQLLQRNNFTPISVEEEKQGSRLFRNVQMAWEGLKQKDLLIFFRELATLIGAKVPILPSLQAIREQTENGFMRTVTKEVAADVEDGMALSEAFQKHPKVFPPLVVNMVRSGEVSGNLQGTIMHVADHIERSYQLNAKIKGALIYPAFVVTVAGIVGFLVLTFILPRLTQIIKELDVPIPWYTSVMIVIGDFMQNYWWAVLLVFFGGIGGFIYYIKTEAGKKEWDIIKLRLPVFGKLFQYIYLARFAENLAVLLAGGIPIVRSLVVVGDVVNNSVYQSLILRAAEEVKTGGDISTVFEHSAYVPPIVTRMIRIGEETGKLSDILASVAEFYQQEIDYFTKNLSTLIEPILIVILGIGVAGLVFSILLPIYNIAGQL